MSGEFKLAMGKITCKYNPDSKSWYCELEQGDGDAVTIWELMEKYDEKDVVIKIQCLPHGYKSTMCDIETCPLKIFDPDKCYFFSGGSCCFPEFDLTWN